MSLTYITPLALVTVLATSFGAAAQDSPTQTPKVKHHAYRLVDLGTFGGPNSQVNGTQPPMLNDAGVVAGTADTSTPCPYPDTFSQNPYIGPAFKWEKGVLINLGLPPGGCGCLPNAINSSGMVVGAADVIDAGTGLPSGHAVILTGGQIIDAGTLGGAISLANDVNERGEVTGIAANTDPDPLAGIFFPSTQSLHAFIWHAGVMRDLGTLGGLDSFGANINESGQVSGLSFTNTTPNATTGIPTIAPFVWDKGKMTNLGSFGGTIGIANSLNNRGQVVGFSDLPGDLTSHPFIWERGVLTDLGTLGGDNGSANSINEAGQVAGTADLADGTHHAFFWANGKKTDLGTVGSDPCSNEFYMNSTGQVIGTSTDCRGHVLHAFLWENGSMIDLYAMVLPGSAFTSIGPVVINDRGEIVGNGTLANGDTHAVVLMPDGECRDA